jgi:hypothetical protein
MRGARLRALRRLTFGGIRSKCHWFGSPTNSFSAVLHAARPLAVNERDGFLQEVAAALQDVKAPGDGDIYRAIRVAQRRHWDPPLLDHQPVVRRALRGR